jgi:1,4-alpha-glucan branching enzyme
MQPIWVGNRVCVAGDFNGWSASAHPMIRNESLGVHELRVDLAPGKSRYRLVVDGQWSADPFNTEFELNPFGEPNSVVQVGLASRTA